MLITQRILIVDDDPGFRGMVRKILDREDYAVSEVGSVRDAHDAIAKRQFDLVLADFKLPDGDGLQVLDHTLRVSSDTHVVMMTAYSTVGNAVEAMKRGALDYLTKPFRSPDELRLLVSRALENKRIAAHREVLRENFEPPFAWEAFVTEDVATLKILDLAKRVAATETIVLISGPTGSGKEVLARCIHRASSRDQGPFVAVNCAALSPTLIESELFGHEKGAFTGAISRHIGRFERARGGTLFLDEIGELEVSLQSKLLRVLQERNFERVGGVQTVDVDTRIIVATNKDLPMRVKENKFREDLFYRLSTFPIVLPPLRERRNDIEPLTRHFLKLIAPARDLRIAADALVALRDYGWPGNIRELQNIIERATILADEVIEAEHLPFHPQTNVEPTTLKELERRAIERALAENNDNRTQTAIQLGISLRTLQYRLKEYGIADVDASMED